MEALHQLDAYITSHGPFDGVIAFSQGAQLAVTHIVHKRLETPTGKPLFKCAILFSPLAVYDPKAWVETGQVSKVDIETNGSSISIHSLVVWGEKDQWRQEAEGVSKLCDPQTSFTFVHPGAHEIPGIGFKEALGPIAKLASRCILKSAYC
jgi:predicted esterase